MSDTTATSTGRRDSTSWHSRRLPRLILALLVVTPLALSALFMWVAWDPTDTLDEMPVALVNEDHAVHHAGTVLDAGGRLAETLVKSHAMKFEEVSRADAMRGLAEGDYYFAITIPSDFSATLASIGDTATAPALIDVVYNDRNTLLASSIGGRAMASITAAAVKSISASTVGTTVKGLATLGGGIEKAADGSTELHTGTSALADGTRSLAKGLTDKLAPGAHTAAAGGRRLADGTARLADGLASLQSGTQTLGDGATRLADGLEQLTGPLSTAELTRLLGSLERIVGPSDRAAVKRLEDLVAGIGALAPGSRELARQLTSSDADYRSGVDELVAGSARLDDGVTRLGSGLTELAEGVDTAAAGAVKLHDGAARLDDGAGRLASGLRDGSRSLPDLGDSVRQQSLASLLSTPVASTKTNPEPAHGFGPGSVPLLLTVLSALVPLIVSLCLRPLRATVADTRSVGVRAWLRRLFASALISLAVVAAIGTAVWTLVSPAPSPESPAAVMLIVAAATVMNSVVVGVLFAVAGYVAGAVASAAAIMVQLFSFGGVWMIETVPAPFRLLNPISPMTYVRDGLIAAFNGVNGVGSSLAAITAVTALLVVAALIAVRPTSDAFRSSGEAVSPG
ncbi:membrane protein [Gordonia spumicola]|uniref:Membrane protein n=1 Tax=Gordonia spumicola TaxID=589161 RepID=A0A7I9V5C0_9ACTN|nr:YhgE/Pip family protein [Gordonia spumicola]GEE00586.1 membrane protein [Gordonia spumicola]